MIDSVVLITCKKASVIGTGFIVDLSESGRYIATCGHVVNNLGEGLLVEGLPAIVKFNGYDSGLDLAILYVNNLEGMPLILKTSTNSNSGKVIGFSRLLNKPKKEQINGIKLKTNIKLKCEDGTEINAIKLSSKETMDKGYSGSPIICEKSNTVLGVVNIKSGNTENYGLCVSSLLANYTVQFESSHINTEFLRQNSTIELSDLAMQIVNENLDIEFKSSLKSYASQKTNWIEPKLHLLADDAKSDLLDDKVFELSSLIDNPKSVVIKGRQQYGLSCISNFLIHSAWQRKNAIWLRVEIGKLTPSEQAITTYLAGILPSTELKLSQVECIVIDEVAGNSQQFEKNIEIISKVFCHIPIVIMQTIDYSNQGGQTLELPKNRTFLEFNVWPLNRTEVRDIVSKYNDHKYIAEETVVVNRVITDLTALNIPRTILNCLTLLKIYEIEFDESPVNRTEMIRRVLFLLFNVDDVPHYKTRPDVKDCEFILGEFCEGLIRGHKFDFTRMYFLKVITKICQGREIDVEVDVIFDVLYANNILISFQSGYKFKFNYWVFYFAAHRMHHNSLFAGYILEDMNYTSYPEIIEFYCGIDRQRNDALIVLSKDIAEITNTVRVKCEIPEGFDIYGTASWDPSEEQIADARELIAESALESKLPDTVKDHYADRGYDPVRPIRQTINKVMDEYSLLKLIKATNAGARALRNSDYADTPNRHELLGKLMEGWKQLTDVLLILSPMLAHKGNASLEGADFYLIGFTGTPSEKFYKIIQMIPANLIDWYLDETYSSKMAPLLFKFYDNEKNRMYRHIINLMIINKRPKGWLDQIKEFIHKENKNSYYLSDIYRELRLQYTHSFVSKSDIVHIEKLLLMTMEKHYLGKRKPSENSIKHKELQKQLPNRDSENLDI